MAHTPGPWEARPNDGQIILNGSNAYDIQEIFNPQGGFNPEDILLMAAAPELLDALMSAVSILSGWEATSRLDAGDTETVRLCKRAINKAEGRTDEE